MTPPTATNSAPSSTTRPGRRCSSLAAQLGNSALALGAHCALWGRTLATARPAQRVRRSLTRPLWELHLAQTAPAPVLPLVLRRLASVLAALLGSISRRAAWRARLAASEHTKPTTPLTPPHALRVPAAPTTISPDRAPPPHASHVRPARILRRADRHIAQGAVQGHTTC